MNRLMEILKTLPAYVIELTVIILLTFLSVISVAEMASREVFINTVTTKISAVEREMTLFFDGNKSERYMAVAQSPLRSVLTKQDNKIASAVQSIPIEYSIRSTDAVLANSQMHRALSDLKDAGSTLISTGVDFSNGELSNLVSCYQKIIAGDKHCLSILNPQSTSVFITVTPYKSSFYQMRSDLLLALSVICCSALGALIFGLRNNQVLSVRTLALGLATGFIVYLALKGGQHFFLMTSPDVRVASNPYSSAFAGLLAGLFSDKAYSLLATLVDDFAQRIENAAGKNKNS